MLRTIKSFKYAWNGLKTVFKEESNFKVEVIVSILVLIGMYYFKFSPVESLMCIVAIVLVLSAEIVNTAIEDICNKIEPNQDPVIGKVKDIMAGYVLISALSALTLGGIAFYSHFI